MEKRIYLDNSATTRLDERVLEKMKEFYFEKYAVATSEFAYTDGIEAKEALENARQIIAKKLNAKDDEIIFTSSDTESSNLAIKGVVKANKDKNKNHIIVSKIEDFPVLNSAKELERQGYKVTYLPVDGEGFVDIEELKKQINLNTLLVSVQHSNQEIGTIQDIEQIAKICKEKGVIFHTDATHSFMRVTLDVNKIPVDLITIASHTIHGPRGIAGLFVRKGTKIEKIMDGGFQEFNLRPGIENIPGAVGFAYATELITEQENLKIKNLRDKLIQKIENEIEEVVLNGSREKRIPQNANISFHYVEGEAITLHLDMHKIAVNTGSACFSKSLEGSHVIMGIGGDHERAHGSIRFTFGRFNTEDEIDFVVDKLKYIIKELRKLSPLYKGGK